MITVSPALTERPAVPYVAIALSATMAELDAAIVDGIEEVASWLTDHGIALTGSPLCRYRVIDMEGQLEVEAGWTIDGPIPAPETFLVDTLPAGTYGSATYRDLDEGIEGNGALIDWAHDNGVAWDRWQTPQGDAFASRVELFRSGPMDHTDPATWIIEVLIKVAGEATAAD